MKYHTKRTASSLPALLTSLLITLFSIDKSNAFVTKKAYSASWTSIVAKARYDLDPNTPKELIGMILTYNSGTQSTSESLPTGIKVSVIYAKNTVNPAVVRRTRTWWKFNITQDNYSSTYNNTVELISQEIQTKYHTSTLAVDWSNSYRAEDGYGPFIVFANAKYAYVDRIKGLTTGATTAIRHKDSAPYSSSGRLIWTPPNQTITTSITNGLAWE